MAMNAAALLLAAACLLCAASTAHCQDQVFNFSAVIPPAVGVIPLESIALNSTTEALNVTVSAVFCDSVGENCGVQEIDGIPAATLLACGNVGTGEYIYVSERLSSTQYVIISPKSPSYLVEGQEQPQFRCTVKAEDYLPAPIQINMTATTVANVTALVDSQQAAAAAIYDACCAGGSCVRWDESTYSSGQSAPGATNATVFTDLCNMDGNQCTPNGSLVTLDLTGYGLSCDLGTISFSNFTQLSTLILSGNNITGDFSAAAATAFANLTLSELHVNSNPELGGGLDASPTGAVCGLVQGGGLEVFLLGGTTITGALPPCFFDATSSLKQLFASTSAISGEVPALADSTALMVFQAMGTQLSGSLPELPPTLAKLNLSQNALTGPIPDVSAAPTLVSLDLSNNQLSGAVPDGVAEHPALRYLDLRVNNLEGLPQAWTTPASGLETEPPLATLHLSDNPLNSEFPEGLAPYPSLSLMDLDNTTLTGPLPEVPEGGFSSLAALFAAENELTGTVPDSWQNAYIFSRNNSRIDIVRYFILTNNSMSGDIPEWLGGTFINTVIDLTGNDFANGCDAKFLDLGACNDPAAAAAAAAAAAEQAAQDPSAAGAPPTSDDSGGGGGLSGGAVAAIVIVVVLLAGGLGFLGYRYWKRRHQADDFAGGHFERFQDDGVELGRTNTAPVYNAQLAP